jgi:hypothetical protein
MSSRKALSALGSLIASVAFLQVICAPTAQASRARLISLGQASPGDITASNLTLGQGGTASLYIEDERSVFMNPAFLTKFAQFADFEFGGQTTTSNPNAEGGVFLSNGDLKYGLQLGRETSASTLINAANTVLGLSGNNTLQTPDDGVEAIVAGGGAMKWGAAVLFATSEKKTENATAALRFPNRKSSTLEARAGILMDRLQAYGKLLLLSTSETEVSSTATSNKYDGKPGLEGGATYDITKDQKAWGTLGYYSFSGHQTGQNDRDGGVTYISGGLTQFLNPEAATRLFMSVGLGYSKVNVKGVAATPEFNQERVFFPVVIGLENQATDWMVVRASVRQDVLFDQQKNSNTTDLNSPNSTVVAVGPGFRWKKLLLDAVLAGSLASPGNIDGSSLLTRGGLTYSF